MIWTITLVGVKLLHLLLCSYTLLCWAKYTESMSTDNNMVELSRIASSISGFNIIWISNEGLRKDIVDVGIELIHQNILEPQM